MLQISEISDTFRLTRAVDADSLLAAEVTFTDNYRELNVLTGQLHGGYRPHLKVGTFFGAGHVYQAVYNSTDRKIALILGGSTIGTYFLYGDMQSG